MKRRKFVQSSLVATSALTAGIATAQSKAETPKEIIELREYDMGWPGKLSELNNYFKDALIPALNRHGVKQVGVFSELGQSEPRKIYSLMSHASFADYGAAHQLIAADAEYQKASKSYHHLTEKVYDRITTQLMLAFDVMPAMKKVEGSELFELRTYQGLNEDAVRRKIKMFNKEELPIFLDTNLLPVFFGEVIAGKYQPCLTYMVGFKNMDERQAAWKAFIDHPEWKRVSGLAEYANTVSKIIKVFLEPMPYSQI